MPWWVWPLVCLFGICLGGCMGYSMGYNDGWMKAFLEHRTRRRIAEVRAQDLDHWAASEAQRHRMLN